MADDIILSPGQTAAFDAVMSWFKSDRQELALAGYAGTGKTTLAKKIAAAIDPNATRFGAFTGKAANVLREKGCNAGTLHSQLYSLSDHDRSIIAELEEMIGHAHSIGDFAKMDTLVATLEEKRAKFRKPVFELNYESDFARAPLVIVDEYSMLNTKLIEDLRKVAKKILYLGDPEQLPPVEGECSIKPDIFLDEIHRQALESPIIRASQKVRMGETLQFCDNGDFKYQPRAKVAAEEYSMAEQIIVGKNNTRNAWNRRFRQMRGVEIRDSRTSKLPRGGEKLICLKNSPADGLFNGMIDFAASDARNLSGDIYTLDFGSKYGLRTWAGDILGEGQQYDGYDAEMRVLERFDFAYAITCHKSQGSEFESVVIYNEPFGNGRDRRRWLYTAITRSQKRCILVEP